jgi:hypothetical protein
MIGGSLTLSGEALSGLPLFRVIEARPPASQRFGSARWFDRSLEQNPTSVKLASQWSPWSWLAVTRPLYKSPRIPRLTDQFPLVT